MFKNISRMLLLVVLMVICTGNVHVSAADKTFFGERNVAIITASNQFKQSDLSEVTPYIRANIRFPQYSIQSNEIVPYGSIVVQDNATLDRLAQSKQADILLFINLPIYEEYMTTWFDSDILHVNVTANIYLYDAQSKKLLAMRKLRSTDSGEYGSVQHPADVIIQTLNLVLEKLPTATK